MKQRFSSMGKQGCHLQDKDESCYCFRILPEAFPGHAPGEETNKNTKELSLRDRSDFKKATKAKIRGAEKWRRGICTE